MDWVQRPRQSLPSFRPGICFNPCCDGLGSKTPCTTGRRNHSGDVSILVVMDWVQRLRVFEWGEDAKHKVSILVVMDWVQRPVRFAAELLRPASFNPCCDGLGSKTGERTDDPRRMALVSILVVMDWVQRQDIHRTILNLSEVSILVVMDWVQRLANRDLCVFRCHLFQSLL